MLTDTQYHDLKVRVAKGKQLLDGNWGATDADTRQWISVWFDLADMLFREDQERGVFQHVPTFAECQAMQEQTLERVRKQMLAKGYIRQPKERRKRNDTAQSNSISLFATSD